MSEWLTFVIDAFSVMSSWEIFAALLGMAYITFAARESQWCWPIAFTSTLIYTVLFWEGQLPMQSFLHVYYMGMAIYGYTLWRHHSTSEEKLAITNWSWTKQLTFLLVATVLSVITAYYLKITQASQYPYLDAAITIFSVMNTWLMAKKVLQNWLYWVVIDGAAIVLYAKSGFYATVILFSVYTVLAIIGFISWQKLYRQQNN